MVTSLRPRNGAITTKMLASARAETRKCMPLQLSAISKLPSGIVTRESWIVAGTPSHPSAVWHAATVKPCNTGVTTFQIGLAKYRYPMGAAN